jgi:hypothetical protein
MQEHLTGYIDTDYLSQAIPQHLTIVNMPSCGVITRQGTTVEDQSFALFWSYETETDYVIEMGVGDQVDLSSESVVFEGAETCDDYYASFGYIVDANMPVDGATTTGYLRQGEAQGAEKLSAATIGLSAFMSAQLSKLF